MDSARYRALLAHHYQVQPETVVGHVLGEHGDGCVIGAAATTVGGLPVAVPVNEIRTQLRVRSPPITAGVGRTRAGPAGAIVSTLRRVLGIHDGVEELSVAASAGTGVFLGLPVRFTQGRPQTLTPDLSPDECRQLRACAGRLDDLYQRIHPLVTRSDPFASTSESDLPDETSR